MTPERLVIEGLYSYRKKTEVDFTQLSAAGVFGIFGGVGSGKSTLLEAISFALYGETERLNQREQGYNMMNLRSSKMSIDFWFRHQQNRYWFSVKAKRGKKFDKVGSRDRKAYREQDGEWIPLEDKDASRILGLSYDHFKQIVIIPQGKFSEFITKTPKQRTDMLKDLFPLGQYDLFPQVAALKKTNEHQLSELGGRLGELAEYSQQAKKEVKRALSEEEKERNKLEKRLRQLEKQLQAMEEIQKQRKEWEEVNKALEKARTRQTEVDRLRKEVQQYEYVRLHCAAPVGEIRRVEKEQQVSQEKWEELKTQIDYLQGGIGERKAELDGIESRWGDALEQQQTRGQLKGGLDLIAWRTEWEQQEKERQSLVEKLARQTEEKKAKLESLNRLKEQLKAWQKELPDIGELRQLENSFRREQELQQRLASARETLDQSSAEVARVQEQQQRVRKELVPVLPDAQKWLTLTTVAWSEKTEQAEKTVASQRDRFREESRALLRREGLLEFADQLEDGEPCPLCGSVHHPDVLQEAHHSEEWAALEEKINQQEALLKTLAKARTEAESIEKQLTAWEKRRASDQEAVKEVTQNLEACRAERKKQPLQLQEKEVQKALEKWEDQQIRIEKQQQKLEQLEQEIEALDRQDGLQDSLRAVEDRITGLKARLDNEEARVEAKWRALSREELERQWEELEAAQLQYQHMGEQIQKKKKEEQELLLEQKGLQARMEDQEKRIEAARKQVEKLLQQGTFEGLAEVEKLLEKELDTDALREEIESHERLIHQWENRKQELDKALKGKSFEAGALASLQEESEQQKQQLANQREKVGALSHQLDRIRTKLEEKAAYEAEQARLEERQENLRILSNLLRGDDFVEYVSSIYLRQLCSLANDRFQKLTQNQLRLEIDDKYQFVVRDFLNDGHIRSLKTLSGGQTFQAALCLALALSEQIQAHQQVQQPFFFMDEGFGSLDKDSLETVFHTLKQLRKENRTVGVISHVEELQNEIDHYLLVRKDDQEGSQIEVFC